MQKAAFSRSLPQLFEKSTSPEVHTRFLDVVKISERDKSWINVSEQIADIAAKENISLSVLLEFLSSDDMRCAIEHNFYDTAEAAFRRFHGVYRSRQFAAVVPKTLSGFPAVSGGSDQMFFDRDAALLDIRQFIRRFHGNNFLDDYCDGLFFEYRSFPHELRTVLTSVDVLQCFSKHVCKNILSIHIERRYGDIVREDPQAYVYPRLGALGTMAFFPEQFVSALEILFSDLVCFGLSWLIVRPLLEKGLTVPEHALSELQLLLCGKKVPIVLRPLSKTASLIDLIEVLWMGQVAIRRKRLMCAEFLAPAVLPIL